MRKGENRKVVGRACEDGDFRIASEGVIEKTGRSRGGEGWGYYLFGEGGFSGSFL